MGYYSEIGLKNEQIELPLGFRFHPTDEELITHYLCPKFVDANYNPVAIGEADLNKIEPWDLPKIAKMGEKEWYLFCVRDRKYPTGMRTNRATEAGYWKATGKDKEIYSAKTLVGMKKTLVFYKGRAPKGEKTNWIMHEYRLLDGQNAMFNHGIYVKNEWVLSRVFEKNSRVKKTLDNPRTESAEECQSVAVTPLNDPSLNNNETMVMTDTNLSHLTCFSNPLLFADQHQIGTTPTNFESSSVLNSLKPLNSEFLTDEEMAELGFDNSFFGHDLSMSRLLVDGEGLITSKIEFPEETGLCNGGDIDDAFWMF